MNNPWCWFCLSLCLAGCAAPAPFAPAAIHHTQVAIRGQEFLVNGRPTYEGRTFRGLKIEGLLLNARLVQGIFDDRNPATRGRWNYPDGPWDQERNTSAFVAAMPRWRAAGLISFTINLQGGSPTGYSRGPQTWINSAFEPDGTLRRDYLARLKRVLDRADDLGMAPIVGLFYSAQEAHLTDEAAVLRAVDGFTDWLLAQGYHNVLVEVANECNAGAFAHDIIRPARAHELIERIQRRSQGLVPNPAGHLLVSTSFTGRVIPAGNVVRAADFVLLHGNGAPTPQLIRDMVRQTRALPEYHQQPILFNEDDHFDFDRPDNDFLAAVGQYAGWGYFDYRMEGEGFDEGFQSVPANWAPDSSARKRGFFALVAEMSGGKFP